MTTATTTGFAIVGIDPARLATIRENGADDFGNPLTPRVAEGWEPLRCCLRRATRDEDIALICYSPWTTPSPWLEAGPVFVHFGHCNGYHETGEWPTEFVNSHSMLNTFHADGSRDYEHIRFVGPGEDHTAALHEVLAHAEVDHVHVRSSTAGCFTFAVHRRDR